MGKARRTSAVRIGSHLSVAGGMHRAIDEAVALGLDAVQVFTCNQRQWGVPALDEADVKAWKDALQRAGWSTTPPRTVSHNSYLVNLASPDAELRKKSVARQRAELERCERLAIPYCVFHPGAHLGTPAPRDKPLGTPPTKEEMAGLKRIAKSLDQIHGALPGVTTQGLLETTAGAGSTLGYDAAHLGIILGLVKAPERLAVCVDTCHMVAAGYAHETREQAEATIAAVTAACGPAAIRVVHANDSEGARGSRKDRHAHIGAGTCGEAFFTAILHHAEAVGAMVIMETPKEQDSRGTAMDLVNAATLRALARASCLALALSLVLGSAGCRRTWNRAPVAAVPVQRSGLAPGEVAQPSVEEQKALDAASTALAEGEYQKALAQFRSILQDNPLLPEAWIGVGDTHSVQQQWRDAAPAYERASVLDVDNYDAFYGLGVSRHMMGQYVEAVRAYHRAISLRPNDATANVSMAIVYLNMGEPRAAVAYAERAVRIDPNSASARINLGVAYERCQRPAEAITQYTAALELQDPTPRLLINLINAQSADKRTVEAVQTAEELVRLDPSAASWERLGWTRFRAGDFEGSQKAYREGTLVDGRYFPCWNGVAINAVNRWVQSNKADADAATEARHAIRRSLEANPDQPRIARLAAQYQL